MLFPRTTSWGRLAASWLLAMTAVACQPEPPELPDPNEQLPAVDCGDAAPLTITRLSPDSLLAWPPWLQVCTLCPATSITLQLGDDDNAAVDLVTAWGEERHCAVALPSTPPPIVASLPALATVANDSRAGDWDFDVPIAPGRQQGPEDLGSGTYTLRGDAVSLRVPGYPWEARDSAAHWKPRPLLLRLGPLDPAGERVVELAPGKGDDSTQDLCSPTWQLAAPAVEVEGQIATTLSAGDRFPTRFGDRVHRGALQGRLSPNGAQLTDVAVLAVIDITSAPDEAKKTMETTTRCTSWETQLGFNPCTPCEPPDAEVQGASHCVTILSEWRVANRVDSALESLSTDDLSADCLEPSGSAARTDNRETL